MKRLGILGTFVWDRIWTLEDQAKGRPFETWGGVGYALAAGAAALPDGWEIVPLAKVGADLAAEAHAFLDTLPGIGGREGMLVVPEPNNRVELTYVDQGRRGERLTGGVPGWTWDELAPRLDGLDALYVNFLSGFEMDLATCERLRSVFRGPLYGDLHSLFLGCPGAGVRQMRTLPEWRRWLACFDAVQMNEDELAMLRRSDGADASLSTLALLAFGPRMAFVTLGERGAEFATRDVEGIARHGIARTVGSTEGDPTGCGDVWGIAAFEGLLLRGPLENAVARANAVAATALGHRGATGLYEHLDAHRDSWSRLL